MSTYGNLFTWEWASQCLSSSSTPDLKQSKLLHFLFIHYYQEFCFLIVICPRCSSVPYATCSGQFIDSKTSSAFFWVNPYLLCDCMVTGEIYANLKSHIFAVMYKEGTMIWTVKGLRKRNWCGSWSMRQKVQCGNYAKTTTSWPKKRQKRDHWQKRSMIRSIVKLSLSCKVRNQHSNLDSLAKVGRGGNNDEFLSRIVVIVVKRDSLFPQHPITTPYWMKNSMPQWSNPLFCWRV